MQRTWQACTLLFILFVVLLLTPLVLRAEGDAVWEETKAGYLRASRQEWNHKVGEWREVAAWRFDDGRLPEEFHVYSGEWRVVDGMLRAVDGELERNRRIGFATCIWPAFRVEFDVMLQPRVGTPADHIGDIGISLNADAETGSFAKGYVFILAQYMNQATVLYRLNVPYARTEWSPIEAGRLHRVMVEVVKPHLRLWVDGRVVLEGWERTGSNNRDGSDFLEMDAERVLTLHTYDTVMSIDNLRILVPITP